ncbi:MAG: hypothetical protein JWP41_3157, partial [Ramlibacter sp.]|nr:hypothetical protein [Ramlibacter sp.]
RARPLDGRAARELLVANCRAHARADTVGCGAGVLDVWAALRALESRMDDEDTEDDDEPRAAA